MGTRLRLGRLVLLLPALGLGCTRVVDEDGLFYPRSQALLPDTEDRRTVEVEAADGITLRGWWLPAAGSDGGLVLFYGNGETVLDNEARLRFLRERYGLSVLAVDYRGYGFSDGQPSMKGLRDDSLRVYDRLRGLLAAPEAPALVFGRSLGTVAAIHVAAERPVAGLILEAPPSSAAEVIPRWRDQLPWPLRWFVRLEPHEEIRRWSPQPVEEVRRVRAPLLVIQGARDRIVPADLARKVHDAAGAGSKVWCEVPGAGHNNLSIDGEPAAGCLDAFVARIREGAAPEPGGSDPARRGEP